MQSIIYKPIGLIHSPFKEPKNMPVQPTSARGITGTVEIFPEYADGLKDLDGFSHVILLYHLHLSSGYELEVTPFLDDKKRGVFATRAPRRPNNLGLSVVKLQKIEQNVLYIESVDIVDDTPLLDMKPYVPDFNSVEDISIGWLKDAKPRIPNARSDDRFEDNSRRKAKGKRQ